MDLLLLLISTVLTSCFNVERTVSAQNLFIRGVNLSIEPSTNVSRGTNVTVRCQGDVSTSGQQPLRREYTIYKDTMTVYTKTTSDSEDLLYLLPEARVSNTGKYKCKINIDGKQMSSNAKRLTVTGQSRPVLNINKGVVSEGEEIMAKCSAPGETGSIIFYFYMDSKEMLEERVSSNQVEAKLLLSKMGFHKIHCTYTVIVTPDFFSSDSSDAVTVSVKEVSVTPVLGISPQHQIYEGDRLDISCTIRSALYSSQNITLYLSQGTKLLSIGTGKLDHSMTALAEDSGAFECRLEMGNVVKSTTDTVSVTELFSVPTLSMSPAEVFERDPMTLTCKSESYASERLSRDDVTYALEPPESLMTPTTTPGLFSGKILTRDVNYTCKAHAKGIVKQSKILTVRPKVPVSEPKISVVRRVILGQPFQLLCLSERGSLPINYTLWKDYSFINTTTVKLPTQEAIFTQNIHQADEISKYMCEASNDPKKEGLLGKSLRTTVIVPLSHVTLTVTPVPEDVTEGQHLFLICGVKGTPPVTFRWYRVGHAQPLFTNTSNDITMNYQVPVLSKEHSGTYYCEANNPAKKAVRSQSVTLDVRLAMWKKGLIIAACLLAVALLVLVCVLRFKTKKGKREAAAELSVKPSSPKSDDALVNLTHDTEVYNEATVRVGQAAVSVCSERPPNAAKEEEEEEEVSVTHREPEVEYTEVVHPQPADPARVPSRKGTDTVYSELQNSPPDDSDDS